MINFTVISGTIMNTAVDYKNATFGNLNVPWLLSNSKYEEVELPNKYVDFLKNCPCYSLKELDCSSKCLYRRYKPAENAKTPEVGSLVGEISPFYDIKLDFGDFYMEIGVRRTDIDVCLYSGSSGEIMDLTTDIMEEFIHEYFSSLEKKSARN